MTHRHAIRPRTATGTVFQHLHAPWTANIPSGRVRELSRLNNTLLDKDQRAHNTDLVRSTKTNTAPRRDTGLAHLQRRHRGAAQDGLVGRQTPAAQQARPLYLLRLHISTTKRSPGKPVTTAAIFQSKEPYASSTTFLRRCQDCPRMPQRPRQSEVAGTDAIQGHRPKPSMSCWPKISP